jgi:CheY-like chemotaxis protein/tRNA A-37 threonylcarbamoyl transferase component Bud32
MGQGSAHSGESVAQPGDTVDGKYSIRSKLGVGGMATVFLATDLRLKRDVAIKIAHPELAEEAELSARFLREAELMAKLRHPNVLEVYDVGTWRDYPYLVMPYLQGNDLEAWCDLRGGTPLDVDVAVGIMDQVLTGLAAMHALGLVHRDVKPRNILVSNDTRVTLGDLGLSHYAYEGDRVAEPSGTPGYLAPEILVHGNVRSELVSLADVYAAGVTAYWLLTGTRPTTTNLARLIADYPSELEPPSERHPALSTAFDAPVLAAMHEDPAQRPTAAAFREALLHAHGVVRRRAAAKSHFVVVVDDDPQALIFVEEVVREALPGAEVVILRDSRLAFPIIESRPPALVITDLDMPHLNGIELTATIRGSSRTRDVPIIVFSGVGGAAEWQLLNQIGATRFLVKPVDPDTLFDVVRRVVAQSTG